MFVAGKRRFVAARVEVFEERMDSQTVTVFQWCIATVHCSGAYLASNLEGREVADVALPRAHLHHGGLRVNARQMERGADERGRPRQHACSDSRHGRLKLQSPNQEPA